MPFDVGKKEDPTGVAIADQLTAEMLRVQQIHNNKYEEIKLSNNLSYVTTKLSTEQSLSGSKMIVPKAEIIDFSMADIGTIDIGPSSLSIGKLIIAFKNIFPFSKPVNMIRGSLQGYGSAIVLVAVLEGDNVQSWILRQPIDINEDEEQIHEIINNMAFIIVHDLPHSNISAKTWQGFKYYTEALDAYQQYRLSGNTEALSLAGNYSLEAISSEKGYKNPYDLLYLLEYTYAMIGRSDDAEELCNKTLELDPKSAYGWENKGYILNSQQKYQDAIKCFDKVIRLEPDYSQAWNSKGYILNNQQKYDEAIKCFEEAIRLEPDYAQAWSNKGYALYNLRNYDDAIKNYDEAIRLDSKYIPAWYNKGYALYNMQKYDDAIKAYDEAIRLDSKYIPAWYNKGYALYNMQKYYDAIECFDEVIRLDPEYAPAWNNKGYILNNQKNYDDALKCLEEAIRIDPNNAPALKNKGYALFYLGKYNEAITAIDMAIEIDPQLAEAWNNKGNVLQALNRTTEADAAFARAKELGYID
jgi:tetratricopeptide (TPR) repeat protein